MIYLDNAATSWPKPEIVYRVMDDFARNHAGNPGRSGHQMALEAEETLQACRGLIARLLNAEDPSRIVLTLNATDALNIALKGFLREGDHVITTELEHNSINRPLAAMAKAGFMSYDKAKARDDGTIAPETISKLLKKNTRLVVITHCSNVLGTVNPIVEIAKVARAHSARILVDASQSVGVVPIDVRAMDLDMVAFPGHKNLFGPMGTGALYVREGLQLNVWREGGTGFKAEEEWQPEEMPFHLEGGTPNMHGYAGLAAGVQFVLDTGLEKILRHERALAMRLVEKLQGHDRIRIFSGKNPHVQLGPVSTLLEGKEPAEVGAVMDQKYGIACRPGLHCAPGTHRAIGTFPKGTVRFSFGFFNTEEQADAAAKAMLELAEGDHAPGTRRGGSLGHGQRRKAGRGQVSHRPANRSGR